MAWKALEDLYSPKGFTSQYLIIKALLNTNLLEYKSLKGYINKIKELINDLEAKELIFSTFYKAFILSNLTNKYKGFIFNIS